MTDTSKHTPGPWFAGKMHLDGNGISDSVGVGPFEADDHYEDTICEVWNGNHDAQANARLIAAAPDLLEALKGAEEWLQGWASAEPYLAAIQAAIAKAEKGQS